MFPLPDEVLPDFPGRILVIFQGGFEHFRVVAWSLKYTKWETRLAKDDIQNINTETKGTFSNKRTISLTQAEWKNEIFNSKVVWFEYVLLISKLYTVAYHWRHIGGFLNVGRHFEVLVLLIHVLDPFALFVPVEANEIPKLEMLYHFTQSDSSGMRTNFDCNK